PKVNTKVVYHGFTQIAGAKVDYAHHGPGPGRLHWTKGNAARSYLRSILMDDISKGREPADLIIRGHYHEFVREWATYQGKCGWMVIMLSICYMGDSREQTMKAHYYIAPGTVAFEIIEGKIINMYPFIKT